MASFTIVLPCFNPREGWKENVLTCFRLIQQKNPEHQFFLTVVNDGSAKKINWEGLSNVQDLVTIDYEENKGKGFALREGVRKAVATDYYIYTDIDFPYTEESFQKIIFELLNKKVNIAVGVRENKYYQDIPRARKIISRFLRWGINKLFQMEITDTQCGLKGFDRKGKELFLQTTINRYLFDLEFIFLASKRKDIVLKPVVVELKENIVLSKVKPGILIGEGGNFLKIFYRSLF